MNSDLISVVIPCYNTSSYLLESISSIISQTYKKIEILIINDGSDDPTTLELFRCINNPLVVVISKENGHLSSARNYGFIQAKGKYVLTLDSDDLFHPDFLQRALDILRSDNNIAAVSSWAQLFGDVHYLARFKGGSIEEYVVKNQSVACALIRKEVWDLVGGYDENMKQGYEDWDFWLRTTNAGYRVHVIQEPLFYYRREGKSMKDASLKAHNQIFGYIFNKNRAIFQKYYEQAIKGREEDLVSGIQRQQEIIDRIYGSWTYRIGNIFATPLKVIRLLKSKLYDFRNY